MEIDKAFKRLLIKDPFWGLFCMSLPRRVTDSVDTLSVCKKGITCELLINPDFWAKHSDNEQLALLKHELNFLAPFYSNIECKRL